MKPNRIFIVSFIFLSSFIVLNNLYAQREVLSFDKGWKFYLGEVKIPVLKGHDETYGNAKAGTAWGAASPSYKDSSWRVLNLPHDWAVEGGFDSTENVSQGFRKRGVGWYRRQFKLDEKDRGQHLEIQFEGIATYATIWFNGTLVHRNWCGYTSAYIDITPFAKYGKDLNTIAVRVDANAMEGWWYEGAGIYRHTWLVKRNPVHIETDGVYAHPRKTVAGNWIVPIEVLLNNSGQTASAVEVETTIWDKNKNIFAKKNTTLTLNTLHTTKAAYTIDIQNPTLWSLENPYLYTVSTVVKKDGAVVDESVTRCGFRTIRFTNDAGFYLNDKHIKLQGVCNHQDHAGVGVALPDALWAFRLRKLKELGVNAYRCSHNPPPKLLLDLCDEMGILVMDENRNFNVSDEYVRQLEWMVRRDRNHPSIIFWSVFNEEPMQGSEQGYEMVRRMSSIVKTYDTTRPITAAMNGGFFSKLNVSHAVDVVGFNYQIGSYDPFHKAHPEKPLTSSEDGSAFQTRGEYVTDSSKNIINAYDDVGAPWGSTHRSEWQAINQRPWLAGGFYWTGFDYRGEPTPFTWPSVSSYFGIMDVCGFPKGAYWIHQAQWRSDTTILQLVPHWNWPATSIGKKIKVMCYSNVDSIVLKLNGKMIGGQKADFYEMNTWWVPYAPGKLEAIGYKNKKEVKRCIIETTGAAVALELVPDRNNIDGDGLDAMPITVKVIDSKGRDMPTQMIW